MSDESWGRHRHPAAPDGASGSAEVSLVFRLAHAAPSGATPSDVNAVRDWNRVLRVASEENAVIALRAALNAGKDIKLPSGLERYIAVLALEREFRMRQLQARMESTLAALNSAGIDVLLLKGGALASTVYRSFAARPMRDIDILVRPERADEARALMLEHDWVADPDVPGDRSYGTHHHLPPLRDAGASGQRLEIHRAVLPAGHPFGFTDDEIWGAARRHTIGDAYAFVMQPAHHAVHVAIHFAWSHMFKMGAWHAFRDLATLTAANMMSWQEFIDTAARWRASTCCYWTLRLANMLGGLEFPATVLDRLQPTTPEVIRRLLARHFVNGLMSQGAACPSDKLERALWTMAVQPNREGHGAVRPWLVSLDLFFALKETEGEEEEGLASSLFQRVHRSGRYLTNLLG